MSLNFDLTACKTRLGEDRWEVLTTSPDTLDKPAGERRWHAVTDTLIWIGMAVDLNEVTEDNVDEWCFRIGLLGKISEPIAVSGGIGRFELNRNDIVNHIGMRTNCTKRNRAQWLARIFEKSTSDARRVTLPATQEPSAADRVNAAYAEWKQKELQAASN